MKKIYQKMGLLVSILVMVMMNMSLMTKANAQCECIYGIEPSVIPYSPENNQFYGNETTIKWQYYPNGTSVPISTCVLNFSLQNEFGDYLILINNPLGTNIFQLPRQYVFEVPNGTQPNTEFKFIFILWYNVTYGGDVYTFETGLDYVILYLGETAPSTGFDWDTWKPYIIAAAIIALGFIVIIIIISSQQKKKDDIMKFQKEAMLIGAVTGTSLAVRSDAPKGLPKECTVDVLADTKTPQGIFCRDKYREIYGYYPDESPIVASMTKQMEQSLSSEKKEDKMVKQVLKPEKVDKGDYI